LRTRLFDEFIYLTRDPTRINDYYNLEVTEFAKIESEGTSTYCTCSAKGFTLYIDRARTPPSRRRG
jgi:hypothetical protein